MSVQRPGGTTEYAYDADGIRVRSVTDGVVTNYLADKNRDYAQVLEERDIDGNLTVSYVYGDDLISQKRGGSVSYYHYDGLGSTRSLTDAAGNVTDTYTYEAFGDILHRSGSTENDYLFTGEQYDPNAGFYYLRARYYNPGNGRFIIQDPYEGDMSVPFSLHRYLYANANPVMYVDPGGKFFSLIELAIGNFFDRIVDKIYNQRHIARYLKRSIYAKTFVNIYKVTEGYHQYVFAEFVKGHRVGLGIRFDYGAGETAERVFSNIPKSLFADHFVDDGFDASPAIWGVNAKGFRSRPISLSAKQFGIWAVMTFGMSWRTFDRAILKRNISIVRPITYNLRSQNCVKNAKRAFRNAKLVEKLPSD